MANLLPLYAIILIGFIAGRLLKNTRWESIATLLVYVIAPVVVFFGIMSTPLNASKLSLPFIFFFICCALCLLFFFTVCKLWPSPERNILAFASATGNTGYFGLPIALFLFGEEAFGIGVLIALGFILYENTLGFFITARGHHTTLEALSRVLRLPTVYAFILAVILNLSGVTLHSSLITLGINFRGAYFILGMMMIGLGVAQLKTLKLD
ncbi:MAG: AEC family transporter, partial [Gammaproteobacteria bacterium]